MELAVHALLAAACMNDVAIKSAEPEPPPIEVGALGGRDGVAFGLEFFCKVTCGDLASMVSPGRRV